MGDINIKSSTIEKSLDLAKDFLQKLVGPAVDEIGLLFADNVKIWRLRNQVKNLEKVRKIVEAEKVDVKKINLKVLVPYLEGVSLEDEETLQEMWAKLFTNYIDTDKNLTLNVYPDILRQLSTNEVALIKYMSLNGNRIATDYKKLKDIFISGEEIANLERLGLISEALELSQYGGDYDDHNGQYKWQLEELSSGKYYLTKFGHEFLGACER